MSWWNPSNWFNNRGGGGMDDGQAEEFYGGGGISTWDSESDKTTTYDNWAKYDAGQPSGSWVGDGGYKTSWSDAFRAADKWNQGKKGGYRPGYMSGGSFNWPNQGVIPISSSTKIVNTMPNWGKYQVYNPPQKQGGGIGGMIGNIVGTVAGSTMGPLGAKIGGSIGGSIGSSF